ncbi:MAG: transcription antitermination factor NusB [Candidatus Omnitrophota bacterium]
MGKRRKGRELALRCLYSLEIRPDKNLEERLTEMVDISGAEPSIAGFALNLVGIVRQNRKEIDRLIARYSSNWSFDRVALLDRNILRLALSEMLQKDSSVPPVVCIDEAVELAKTYGTEESYRFVNGILNKVKEDFEAGKVTCLQKGP